VTSGESNKTAVVISVGVMRPACQAARRGTDGGWTITPDTPHDILPSCLSLSRGASTSYEISGQHPDSIYTALPFLYVCHGRVWKGSEGGGI
jgi:hypothetical protein